MPGNGIPNSAPEPNDAVSRAIGAEKKWADRAFSAISEHALPLLVPVVGGPALAALISPNVSSQTTFVGVFVSTLALSLAVAIFTALALTGSLHSLGGMQLTIVAVLLLVGTTLIAGWLGVGAFAKPVPGGSPPLALVHFLQEAVNTFGVVGALLGAVSGFLAGRWTAMWMQR